MDGIYVVYFTGMASTGYAVFVAKNGVITGADAMGGTLDGTYEDVGDNSLNISATLTVPPCTPLVTGMTAGQYPLEQQLTAKLPVNLGGGGPVGVSIPTGPVNAVFRRLRDIP